MESLRESIKNEKDAAKVKIKENRITGRQNALDRFDKAIEKISVPEARVNALIEKMAAKGVDVAKAKSFMQIVEAPLIEAKIKISEANTLFSVSINKLNAEQKNNLKTITKDIQTLINTAHQSLDNAVKALKNATKLKMEAETNSSASEAAETD